MINVDLQNIIQFNTEAGHRTPDFRHIPLELAVLKERETYYRKKGFISTPAILEEEVLIHHFQGDMVTDGVEYALGARIVTSPIYTERDLAKAKEVLEQTFTEEEREKFNIETAINTAKKETLIENEFEKKEAKDLKNENRSFLVVNINYDEKPLIERPYEVTKPKNGFFSREKKETRYMPMLKEVPAFGTDDGSFEPYFNHLGEFTEIIQRSLNMAYFAYRLKENDIPDKNLLLRIGNDDLMPESIDEKPLISYTKHKTPAGPYVYHFSTEKQEKFTSWENVIVLPKNQDK